jgi:hypothetical protein
MCTTSAFKTFILPRIVRVFLTFLTQTVIISRNNGNRVTFLIFSVFLMRKKGTVSEYVTE